MEALTQTDLHTPNKHLYVTATQVIKRLKETLETHSKEAAELKNKAEVCNRQPARAGGGGGGGVGGGLVVLL